jgi:type I restriction enzyme S subunit
MSKIKRVPLGDVAEFINGVAFKPEDWCEDGQRIIRIQNLTDSSKPFNRTTRVVHEKYHVQRGDLLVSWSATLGVFVWDQPDAGLVNQHIFRVVPHSDCVDADYLRQMLIDALVEMERHLHGATMKHVNRGEFLTTTIPLPPLAEQKRIAAILDAADALRTKRRESLAQLDALLQSTFLTLFGDPVTNPMGWPLHSLKELGKVKTGGTPPSAKTGMFDGPIPFITPGDLGSGRPAKRSVTEAGAAEAEIVRAGATFVCCIGATIGKMGKAEVRSSFNQQINAVEWSKNVDDEYGLGVLNFFKTQIAKAGASTTLPILKKSSFEKIRIPLPPLPLQQKFAAIVESIERQKTTQRAHLAELDALFAALQHRAFRGEL